MLLSNAWENKIWSKYFNKYILTSTTFWSHFFILVCCTVSSLGLFLLFLISHMVSSMNSICQYNKLESCWKGKVKSSINVFRIHKRRTLLPLMFAWPCSDEDFNSFTLFCTLRIKFFISVGSSLLSFIPQPVTAKNSYLQTKSYKWHTKKWCQHAMIEFWCHYI